MPSRPFDPEHERAKASGLEPGPEDLRAYHVAAKKRLRQKLRGLREALPMARASIRSETICERLKVHRYFVAPRGVALFWPMVERREVDLRPLDRWLRERQIPVCYPFMEREPDGSTLTGFRWVLHPEDLREGRHRFAEPPPNATIAKRGEVDVVVVPALAVTLEGHRLGYGSGFYDATLADLCPPARSIVVAFDFQRLVELPEETHDKRCDDVVTDA